MKTKKATAPKTPKPAKKPKAPKASAKTRIPDFANGQVWAMGEDRLQIRLVGKTLVHYRHYKGGIKRPPTRFTSKNELEKILFAHKAMLVQE